MSAIRAVHVGVDRSKTQPDTWRLFAECADEQTEMVLIGSLWTTLLAPVRTERDLFHTGVARELIEEHVDRCGSCRQWRANA